MARKTPTNPVPEQIIDEPMADLLSERYLSYALSTIMARSLPDVRDGLKPVHRRVLFAMYQLKLSPNLPPKKSARVVGDVIGKFHPHGDQSVYDTLVRLAQDFAVRYPLVDGQGNFGNIDGDNAAAMRYTESRLTETAISLLEGIDQDAVDFRYTYDGDTEEPTVLPSNFPNLLANGASGIAVGMATNIPPHNVAELCEAMELMLEKDASIDELLKIVKGPDFPTGGILVESSDSILESYRTGRGSFRTRARWVKEDLKQGQWQIVVTEIPYQVQKAKLIEQIANLITNKKIPMLDDVCDESAEDIRLVLIPKNRNVEPELLMEALYRASELENRFSLNMNVLQDGIVPRVMNLKEVLQCWLNHRQDVLVRRSNFRLGQVNHRLEVLAGYLIVYLNIDEVIRIIRESEEPRPALMEKFGLTEVQAEAILNMRLRSLRKLEEIEIRKEFDALEKEKDGLEKLLKSEAKQWAEIKKQIGITKKIYGPTTVLGARRTTIGKPPAPISIDLQQVMVEKEPITVILSAKGWIRAIKGHGVNPADLKYKEGDREQFVLEAQTTDKLVVFASNGRFYTITGDKLPPGRGLGEPLRLLVDIPNDADIVQTMVWQPDQKILVATRDGKGFIVSTNEILAQTKNGKTVMSVSDNGDAQLCKLLNKDDDHLALIGTNRKFLVFKLDQIPEMTKGKGVILQKYKGAEISDAKTFNMKKGLTYTSGTREMSVSNVKEWLGDRAQVGKLPPNGFPRSNKFR
ncbi:MAG: DNA topoisomerase IV subunit A [Alphaproteobacteria bacterium]|nr:DNA topoisomerase IV subunit A [Alphaproteobacteria bacterium]MCB9984582.1 DNA topoisomerase IV subunit A [Micavibrio sp.]